MASLNSNPPEREPINGSRDYFLQPGHFKSYSDRTQVFLDQLHFEIGKLPQQSTVLDVGCGHGIALRQEPQFDIAKRVGTYWGIEPDKSVTSASCFDHVWATTLEDAEIPDSSVDLAYSQMVLEHVLEPEPFLRAIARILKPGGVFLSLTVNSRSTFARIASTCQRLHIQDLMLRIAVGKQKVDEYHYPAVYLMTSKPYLEKHASQYGLSRVDVTFLEADEWMFYFPKGTRWFGEILTRTFQRRVERYSWLLVKLGR